MGYMGSAVRKTNYPQRCYNAQNHWRVGWFSRRAVEVDPHSTAVYKLAPFVDYNKTAEDEYVVIKVTGLDLYLQFNRQKSFNIDTGEFPDSLAIVKDTGEGTNLLAGLNLIQSRYEEIVDSKLLTIEVCSMQLSNGLQADMMKVSIGFGPSLCSNPSGGNLTSAGEKMTYLVVAASVVSAGSMLLAIVFLFLRTSSRRGKEMDPRKLVLEDDKRKYCSMLTGAARKFHTNSLRASEHGLVSAVSAFERLRRNNSLCQLAVPDATGSVETGTAVTASVSTGNISTSASKRSITNDCLVASQGTSVFLGTDASIANSVSTGSSSSSGTLSS
jgi:hypothetical protein